MAVLPALLVAGIALIVFKLADGIYKRADEIAAFLTMLYTGLKMIFSFIMETLSDFVGALKALPTQIASAVKDALKGPAKSIKGLGGKLKDGISGGFNAITGRAVGGPASGLTLVGEQGPELVRLPSGSRVHTNRQSAAMMGGVTNNITVQVTGRVGANDSEIRDIANKVAREINTRINRTSTSVVKF